MTKSNKIVLLTAATLMMLFLGVLYTWSMFSIRLGEMFPSFTAARLSLCFTIASVGFCVGGFLGGKLNVMRSPSFTARVSAVLFLVGFFGASCMEFVGEGTALVFLYVFHGIITGLAVGIGYNACMSGTNPWFADNLGLASGIMLMGFGFGSLLLGLLVESMSLRFGVFVVYRFFAVLTFCVILAGSFFLKKPAVAAAGGEELPGLTPGQMLSRPSFWLYFLWNIICASTGLMVISASASIAVAFGTAAGLGLIVSIFNGAGRPVTGAVMDKLGQFGGMTVMNCIMILGGILLVVGAKTHTAALVLVGMILVGITYGGGVTISAKVINVLYGPKHYGVNFSLSNFCMIPAAFIGPLVSGVLQDRSGGSYDSTFVMLLIMAAIALCDIFLLRAVLKREK